MLNITSKITESIICNTVDNHRREILQKKPIRLSHESHYYCTCTLLYCTVKYWKHFIDVGKVMGAIFIDFRKVFGSVSHDFLCYKIQAKSEGR